MSFDEKRWNAGPKTPTRFIECGGLPREVSWAGPAQKAEAALRKAADAAESHKREEAIAWFREAEDKARMARYFLEDEKIAETALKLQHYFERPWPPQREDDDGPSQDV